MSTEHTNDSNFYNSNEPEHYMNFNKTSNDQSQNYFENNSSFDEHNSGFTQPQDEPNPEAYMHSNDTHNENAPLDESWATTNQTSTQQGASHQEQHQQQGFSNNDNFDNSNNPPSDGASHLNNEKPSEKKSERFIMGSLLSAVIIVATVIGLGWALFYPKDNITAIEQKPQIKPDQEEASLEQNEDGDVVIIYGGEEENLSEPQETAENAQEEVKPESANTETQVAQTQSAQSIKKTSENVATTTHKIKKSKPVPIKEKTQIAITSGNQSVKKTQEKTTPASAVEPSLKPKKTTQGVMAVPNTKQQVYWVQVFSTSNKNKADTLKTDLEQNGVVASIVTKNINSKVYYRLRIGPYYNKAEGNKFLQWIKQSEKYKDAYVTQTYI